MTERDAARAAAIKGIAERCPPIHMGDEWMGVIGTPPGEVVTIVAIEPTEGSPPLPWPLVTMRDHANAIRTSYGAPAFIGATLVSRGEGAGWKPGDVVAEALL